MLNKLLDMSDSWHLKRRYKHITIKMLQVKYGQQTTSMLRNHKHARIETSITRRWFNHYNGMMRGSHLDIKPPEIMEQGRMGLKLKMVTPTHIKHKSLRCNASALIKKFEKHTNWIKLQMKMMRGG